LELVVPRKTAQTQTVTTEEHPLLAVFFQWLAAVAVAVVLRGIRPRQMELVVAAVSAVSMAVVVTLALAVEAAWAGLVASLLFLLITPAALGHKEAGG
jgi:CHASE2 domain-containing sensor protein